MKVVSIFVISLLLPVYLFAQKMECGTKTPVTPLFVDNTVMPLTQYTSPLLMKVFVHVVANNDGTSRAVADTSIFRQLENMRQFYAPHGICFILAGTDQINNTDLNNQNTHTEESELLPYLIPGLMNIFVHSFLLGGTDSLNGSSYTIPNYYLSLSRSAIESVSNRATTAHEIGHCFGLYHTFETSYGAEKIDRTGQCTNCVTAGDLLCDTEADPESDSYETANHTYSCVFSDPFISQFCNGQQLFYQMDPHNIMSYGVRECNDLFTAGQGNRARNVINNSLLLQTCIAPDTDNITANQTISSGREFFIARNIITVSATSFIVNNSAMVNIVSNTAVVLKPGTTFSPTTVNGYVSVTESTLCQ